jgi:hypothetical protein
MTSPPSGGSEYIADYEHAAYEQGLQEYEGVSNVPLIGDALSKALSQAKATQEAAEYGQQQAEELSADQQLREKPSALGGTHYLSYGHKEMDRFVKENFDPAAVHDVGRVYHAHGQMFIDYAAQIKQAAEKTQETWQGEAGDAMRSHVKLLADHMSHSGNAAQLTATEMGMQAEAGERARNSMPEVIEFDMKKELLNYFSDPNPFTAISRANDIMEKQEQSQAAHQEAAQVMSTMETGFGEAAARTPAFVPVPRPPDEPHPPIPPLTPPPVQPPPIGPGPDDPNSSTNTNTKTNSPKQTQSSWADSDTSTPKYTPPQTTQTPQTTHSMWQQQVPTNQQNMRWNPNTGQWERQNPYNGRWAPLPPGQQPPRPGGAGAGRPSGMGGGAGRAGGGVGGAGRIGGLGGAGGAGQLGAGGRAGVGGLGAGGAGGGSGAAGAAGARGGAGMAGGAAGAGRGQGGSSEDDNEHESKYVLDSDEAWDDLGLPKVAPPVFGE